MSLERSFIVEVDNDADASMMGVQKGRYLVIQALAASGPVVPEVVVTLLATSLDREGKMVKLNPQSVKFLGFRGDCMICGTRQPEKPE